MTSGRSVGGFLDRAARHCAEIGADPDDFVQVRLFEDMAPFHFQIEAAWHHAVWGLEAAKTGVFAAPRFKGVKLWATSQSEKNGAGWELETEKISA